MQKPYRKNSATPSDAAFYAKGIAVANWMNALEYVQKCICVLEYSIELNSEVSPQRSLLDGLGWLEDNMSIIYNWKRTCSEFSDRMDNNLMELNIPLLAMESLGGNEHKDAQDWLYIHKRLQMWMSRSRDLVQSALGLLSRVEAERSLGEARNTRLLAILGTIFLPLSLVSSIFSMGGDFLPGQPRFWVYLSISLPLLFIALAVVFAPQRIIEIVVLLTPRW
jgi:hypothetical protein